MTSDTFRELIHSRPLDVHKWSDYREVNDVVDHIFARLPSLDGNKNKAKKHLKVLLLDLYVAWFADPELKIAVSRNRNDYKAKSRYNELHISYLMVDVVDALVEHGFLNLTNGFYDQEQGRGYVSRIWPSEPLEHLFKAARFSPFMIESHSDRETVILRDDSGKDMEVYEDTDEVLHMRRVLKKYNDLLARTHIDLDYLQVPVLVLGNKKRFHRLEINQQSKSVRRVFNKGRFDKGGRFYGGWWQRCPSELRPHIVMDGVLTEEVDFSGLHIALLYARRGINYWEKVGDDPYNIVPPCDWPEDINLRETLKMLLLTAINADNEKKAFKAFRRQAEAGSSAKNLNDTMLGKLLSALRDKHQAIAEDFATAAGIDLMFIDSQITSLLIEHYTDRGVPILTIHDSYIVPFGYSDDLISQMKLACERITGVRNVKVKHTTISWRESSMEEEVIEELGLDTGWHQGPPSQRHLKELELFREFKSKPEREDWVSTWTPIY